MTTTIVGFDASERTLTLKFEVLPARLVIGGSIEVVNPDLNRDRGGRNLREQQVAANAYQLGLKDGRNRLAAEFRGLINAAGDWIGDWIGWRQPLSVLRERAEKAEAEVERLKADRDDWKTKHWKAHDDFHRQFLEMEELRRIGVKDRETNHHQLWRIEVLENRERAALAERDGADRACQKWQADYETAERELTNYKLGFASQTEERIAAEQRAEDLAATLNSVLVCFCGPITTSGCEPVHIANVKGSDLHRWRNTLLGK
jgi:hypothetical protein